VRANRSVLLIVPACVVLLCADCASYRPPFVLPRGASSPPDAHAATLVVFWPIVSCDPPGYYLLATTRGAFLGSIVPGAQLLTTLPAGEVTVFGWNPVMEADTGGPRLETLPVLRAELVEGRTYYARLAFGVWTAQGPLPYAAGRCPSAPGPSPTSALLAVTPRVRGWSDVAAWRAKLETILPDRVAGQAWIAANPEEFRTHRAVGEDRWASLRPDARTLATLGGDEAEETR
jgi:hypothetical protein